MDYLLAIASLLSSPHLPPPPSPPPASTNRLAVLAELATRRLEAVTAEQNYLRAYTLRDFIVKAMATKGQTHPQLAASSRNLHLAAGSISGSDLVEWGLGNEELALLRRAREVCLSPPPPPPPP
jgi:hypothetical protein